MSALIGLTACGGGGGGGDETPPPTITDTSVIIKLEAVSASSVNLTWPSVSTADAKYHIYRSNSNITSINDITASTVTHIASIATTSYTDDNAGARLDAGTNYYYKIFATDNTINNHAELVPLASSTASTQLLKTYTTLKALTKPAKTTGLAFLAESTKSSLKLKWDNVTGATGYKVYYHIAAFTTTTQTGVKSVEITSTATEGIITGLTAGTQYFVRVLAINGSGNGELSDAVDSYALLAPPTTISAVALSSSSIYLNWSAVANAKSYRLCFDTTTPIETDCMATNIAHNFYTHTSLTQNTAYHYKVLAVNGDGVNSKLSTAEAIITTFLTGQTVADFAQDTTKIEKNAINLKWTTYAGATAYNLYYQAQSSVDNTVSANALSTKITLANVTEYKLTGLASNAVYGLKIQAVTNGGVTDLGNGIISAPLATSLALGRNTIAGSSTISVVHPGIDIEVHRSETADCDLSSTGSCTNYSAKTVTTQGTGFVDKHSTSGAYYKLKTSLKTSNSVQIDTTITATNRFSARYGHEVVIFKNEFYLIGGWGNTRTNDVWKSADGVNWTELTASAEFSARNNHQVVVFNNELYLIGGADDTNKKNDVWKSADGVNWTELAANAEFSIRSSHQVVVFKNELYLIGGYGSGNQNDVWKSADGVNWTELTASAEFSTRNSHQVVIFNNELYLIGGFVELFKNDVWKSADGITWTQVTASANFPTRINNRAVIWNNQFYVIGGYVHGNKNDIWKSADGATWTQVTTIGSILSGRHNLGVVVWNNELYLMGGYGGGSSKNDIWKSSDGATWFEMFPSQPITW